MKHLKSLEQFSFLDDSQISIFDELSKTKEYSKNTVLLKQGSIAENLIFLKSGITASIYEKQSKRFVRDFYFEPHIFTEQQSFIKKVPAKFSIISITNITCELISFEDLETLYDRIPKLRNIAYNMLLNGFINISDRLETLLTLTPEDRYIKLLADNPKLLHKIPLKMIASYLGITDVGLSRIRKRISLPKK
jgi:CRP-like cAMP-binding protein